jgi:Flagellar hook-length control protein FliK
MKASDAEVLAAAARAGLGTSVVRAVGEALATATEGFFDVLAAQRLPDVPEFEPGKRTEQVRSAMPTDAQLVAAAHAVAAHWLSTAQLVRDVAAQSGDAARPAAPPNHSVTISVNHVTPEGGLAAVELSHPDLGPLALEVSLSGQTLSVLATAESEHAATAIREGQAALAQQLQAQGIKLQALSVVVLRRRARAQNPKSRRQES